jgi:hypothetical protein
MSYVVSARAVVASRVAQRFDVATCLAWFSPITGLENVTHPHLPTAEAVGFLGATR